MFAPFSFLQKKEEGVAPTPTPTPTLTPTVTPTATPEPTPTPTPTATPLPFTTSGLTLYLDAGDSSSYPGTGTTWYDLSGNNNHGTLVNGASYVGSPIQTMVFDGADDYVTFETVSGMPTGSSQYSIITFFNVDQYAQRDGLVGWGQTGSTNQFNALRTLGPPFETGPGFMNFWWANDISWTTFYAQNTWNGVSATWDGSTRQMYLNYLGMLGAPEYNAGASGLNVTRQDTLTVGRVAGGEYMDGKISVVMVYNRKLSNEELTSIWDYFKGRYGY